MPLYAKESLTKKLNWISLEVLRRLGAKQASVRIFLVSEREITAIKSEYFFKRRPLPRRRTPKKRVDVLAFPEPQGFPHPEASGRLLGEVYLNYDLLGRDPRRLFSLALHGILHLLGYRHHKRSDSIKMETMERKLWDQISLSV